MKKTKLLIVCMVLFLTACGSTSRRPTLPPVEIITTTVPLSIYGPPAPPDLLLEDVKMVVITPENFDERILEVERLQGDGNFVVVAMTPQDYENMAYNFQELKRYTLQQQEIIDYYRKVTSTTIGGSWEEQNAILQERQREQIDALTVTPDEPEEKESFWSRIIPW